VQTKKIDIFKLTPKLLSCVGVGLIKKTLEWQQILSIPSSEIIVKCIKIEQFLFAVFRPGEKMFLIHQLATQMLSSRIG